MIYSFYLFTVQAEYDLEQTNGKEKKKEWKVDEKLLLSQPKVQRAFSVSQVSNKCGC